MIRESTQLALQKSENARVRIHIATCKYVAPLQFPLCGFILKVHVVIDVKAVVTKKVHFIQFSQ